MFSQAARISGVQISQITFEYMGEHVTLHSCCADFLQALEDFCAA